MQIMPWLQQTAAGKFRALYRDGSGKVRSAGTYVQEKEAMREATLAEAETRKLGWRDPQAAKRTWGEWCAEWWPKRGVAAGTLARDTNPRDKHLMPRWGDVSLVDITRHDVKEWASDLAAKGLAPSSVERHLHLFSASLTAAIDKEIIQTNPAARLGLPRGEIDEMRFLTHDEFQSLFDSLAECEQPFVAFLIGTGARWGEGAGLQRSRISTERGEVRIAEVWDDKMSRLKPYPKGRRIRDVPLPQWVADMLPAKTGLIFQPLDYSNWKKRVWNHALETAGIGHARPHDLRHTYASWQIQNGTSLYRLGALLGHVSPSTTQRYAHLLPNDHSAVTAAVPAPKMTNV